MLQTAINRRTGSSRVALLVGSFNPPHLGHLRVANMGRRQFDADRVVMAPLVQSPEKIGTPQAAHAEKVDMCRLMAREQLGWLSVSDGLKHQRPNCVSTVTSCFNLVSAIRRESPNAEIALVCGNDNTACFTKLAMILSCMTMAKDLLCFGGADFNFMKAIVDACTGASSITPVTAMSAHRSDNGAPDTGLSSTQIRRELADNRTRDVEGLHPDVMQYIRERGLYAKLPAERTPHRPFQSATGYSGPAFG